MNNYVIFNYNIHVTIYYYQLSRVRQKYNMHNIYFDYLSAVEYFVALIE